MSSPNPDCKINKPVWPVPSWIPRLKKTDCDGLETRWEKTLLREEGKCVYCGLDLLSSTELLLSAELDHLVPEQIFRGQGQASPYVKDGEYRANLVLCCGPCNDAKANWPLCLAKVEAEKALTKLTREEYINFARKFTLSHRRLKEARCANLMARGWHQRHSMQKKSDKPK